MKAIVKIIAILVSIMLPIMLFIMLYRISRGQTSFFGFSELLSWFEKQDFYKPMQQAIEDFVHLNDTYSSWFNSWNEVNNFWDWLKSLGLSITAVLGYLSYPVILIYELISMIISYITLFFNFFQYIGA